MSDEIKAIVAMAHAWSARYRLNQTDAPPLALYHSKGGEDAMLNFAEAIERGDHLTSPSASPSSSRGRL